MKQLPSNIILEKNRIATAGAWLYLLDIIMGDGTKFHLVNNSENIAFGIASYSLADCTAHWKLNGDGDDSSGNGNTITPVSCSYVSGKLDECLSFDGSSSYAYVTDDDKLNVGTSDFTISFWAKPNNSFITYANPTILRKRSSNKGFEVLITNPGALRFFLNDTDDSGYFYVRTNNTYNDNEWHLFTIAVDRDSSCRIFVDGDEVETTITSGSLTSVDGDITTTSNVYVGASAAGANLYTGLIDDIRLYDRAMTQKEIACLYNSGSGTELLPVEYTAFPFVMETMRQGSKGEIPSVNLKVSNITRLFQPYLYDLNGGTGSAVRLTVVNSKYVTENYSSLVYDFNVLSVNSDSEWVTFNLGVSNPLRKRFPLHRYIGSHCNWIYMGTECGYVDDVQTVTGITLTSGGAIVVSVTGHGYADGDNVTLSGCDDLTPSLDGTYFITVVDDDNFSLNGTDGDDYTGSYVSGATSKYGLCPKTLKACRSRNNATKFGNCPGMRSGSVRIV